MAIIRWNPFDISSVLDEDFNLPTIPGLSRLGQGLNIYETNDSLVAEAAVPGVDEDRVDVTIDDGIVRISAQKEEDKEERGKRRYFMSSMSTSYNYAFKLPAGVVGDEEPATELDNGVLRLIFPKVQKAPPKKLKVQRKPKESKGKSR